MEVILLAIKANPDAVYSVPEELFDDPQIQLAAQSKDYLEVLLDAIKC